MIAFIITEKEKDLQAVRHDRGVGLFRFVGAKAGNLVGVKAKI